MPRWRLTATTAVFSMLLAAPLRADDEIPLKGAPEPQTISPLLAHDMPDQLDAYARTTTELAHQSGRFQDQYQRFIHTLDALHRANKPLHGAKACLPDDLAALYLGARQSWEAYHRQARVVRNQFRRLEAFQSAGYAPGLTPDLQDRLKRAVDGYELVRQEHINIQSLFQGQLEGELKRLGCDPEDIVAPPKPVPETLVSINTAGSNGLGAKPRPRPAKKEKPEKKVDAAAARASDAEAEDAENESAQASLVPAQTFQPEEIESSENLLPPESTPSPDSSSASPSPAPTVTAAKEPSPVPSGEKEEDAEASGDKEATQPTPKPPMPVPGPAELNVTFTVDNRLCSQDQDVYLDSRKLGTAPGKGVVTFSASEGRHSLCLSREGDKDPCKQPTDLIRVYLYDGFAVKPRC